MNAPVSMRSVRSQKRFALDGQVSSRRSGRRPYPTKIMNVSLGGCCLELPFGANIGERVWVTLPGLAPLEAKVCWSERYLTGCTFVTSLHPAVFDGLASRMGAAPDAD